MKILGLDIAATTGWAVIHRPPHKGEQLVSYGTVDARHDRNIRDFLSELWEHHPDVAHAYVETVYVARGPHANPQTTVRLAMLAGAFQYGLSEWCRVHYVTPAKWRSEVLAPQGKPKRKELKSMAIEYAHLAWGVGLTEDEADAACIAFYGSRRQLFGG